MMKQHLEEVILRVPQHLDGGVNMVRKIDHAVEPRLVDMRDIRPVLHDWSPVRGVADWVREIFRYAGHYPEESITEDKREENELEGIPGTLLDLQGSCRSLVPFGEVLVIVSSQDCVSKMLGNS